jgi:predicted methyltransferase MtxX (methanogen marker protein 4)
MNMLAKGKLAVASDGDARVIEAPYLFASEGGRKLVYVIEDAVLMNIYATEETDIDVIEETFVDKSDAWRDAQQKTMNERAIDAAVRGTLRGKN